MTDDTRLLTRRTAIKRLGALIGCTMTASQLSLIAADAAAADRPATVKAPRNSVFFMGDHYLGV